MEDESTTTTPQPQQEGTANVGMMGVGDSSEGLVTGVSIIIPVWNEPRSDVDMTVTSIASSATECIRNNIKLQCIVVDDNSDDASLCDPEHLMVDVFTQTLCREVYHIDMDRHNPSQLHFSQEQKLMFPMSTMPSMHVIALQERAHERELNHGACRARNAGARESCKGDILVFVDGHVQFDPDCITLLAREVRRHGPRVLVTGKILPIPENGGHGCGKSIDRNLGLVHLNEKPLVGNDETCCYEVPIAGGSMIAVDRDFFFNELQGGFDEGIRHWGFEDTDLSLRCWGVGGRVLCNPKAVLRHRYKTKTSNCTGEEWVYNKMRVAMRHFGLESREFDMIKEKDGNYWTGRAISELVVEERKTLLGPRSFDDRYYWDRWIHKGLTGQDVLKKFDIKW